MTLPGSGQIAYSDVSSETGGSFSKEMSWIRAYTKDGVTYFNSFHGRACFARNVDGNCDNGNCANNCNCGNINCNNCIITGGVNCTNCDSQNYLQGNCNCACTYNCTTTTTSYDCNCDCWICACTW